MDEVKQSNKEHTHTTPTPQHEHHEDAQAHRETHTHTEHKHEDKEIKETIKEEAKQDLPKKTEPKAVKKEDKKPIVKKEEAIARGLNLHVSKRQCMYISTFIKNKKIDNAMRDLEMVIKFKKAVPFKGEIPHKKGMMSGRYPVKAAALFITILKGLKGNVLVNGLDPDKTRISMAISNWASRPLRREGKKAKRTNVTLIAREVLN